MPFKDAHEMWYYLFTEYSGENHSRKLAIASINYSGGSIIDFINNNLEILANTITAAGKDQISLTEFTLALILNALPNRFDTVRSFLEQDKKNIAIAIVKSKIKEEDQRQGLRKETFEASANSATGPPKRTQTNVLKCKHNRMKIKM
jgi:hypothetical protein